MTWRRTQWRVTHEVAGWLITWLHSPAMSSAGHGGAAFTSSCWAMSSARSRCRGSPVSRWTERKRSRRRKRPDVEVLLATVVHHIRRGTRSIQMLGLGIAADSLLTVLVLPADQGRPSGVQLIWRSLDRWLVQRPVTTGTEVSPDSSGAISRQARQAGVYKRNLVGSGTKLLGNRGASLAASAPLMPVDCAVDIPVDNFVDYWAPQTGSARSVEVARRSSASAYACPGLLESVSRETSPGTSPSSPEDLNRTY